MGKQKELVTVEYEKEKGVRTRELFELFLENTNLKLSGDIEYYLYVGNFFLFRDTLASIFFYDDWIKVRTCINDLSRVKKVFGDFTKKHDILVNVSVKRDY